MQKNPAAWPYLTGFLRADFAFIQDPAPLPDSINGLLIHSAQHSGKESVLYASGTNGHRLRSTMSLPSGGVVASFSKPGLEDLHLLDVNPWTSVTMESAMSMVQELGRASSFFAPRQWPNIPHWIPRDRASATRGRWDGIPRLATAGTARPARVDSAGPVRRLGRRPSATPSIMPWLGP